MPDPISLIKAGTEAATNIASGIIGSGGRRREEQRAKTELAQNRYNFENFDYNQDVGPIVNPYAQVIQQQSDFQQQQLARQTANQQNALQQSGNFGAAQSLLAQHTDAGQQQAQALSKLRLTGAKYVEDERRNRIADKFNTAETNYVSSQKRLNAARRARQSARASLFKGIGGVAAIGGDQFLKAREARKGETSDSTTSPTEEVSYSAPEVTEDGAVSNDPYNYYGNSTGTGYSQHADPVTGEFNEHTVNL